MITTIHYAFADFAHNNWANVQIKQALSKLQDQHCLNPNIVLFCCWYAQFHDKRFSLKQCKQIISAIHPWHEQVVSRLQDMYCWIKNNVHASRILDAKAELAELVETVEQIERLILAEMVLTPFSNRRSLQQIITDTFHNIVIYCKLLQIRLDVNDCEAISTMIDPMFPEYGYNHIFELCKGGLLYRKRPKLPSHTQLHLPFR